MSEKQVPQIAVEHSKGDKGGQSGGSSGPSSTGVDPLPENAVGWLFVALHQHSFDENGVGDFEIPAHEQNAERELTEPEIDAFGFEEGQNVSIESLFGIEIERPFVGDPTLDNGEKLSSDENEGTQAVARHVTVNLGHAINGYHGDKINEEFGEDYYVRVGMGSTDEHDDPRERARYVRFKTTESPGKAQRRKARAAWNCSDVDFSQADYEQVCEEVGEDPYPRKDNGDDEE